MNKIKSKIELKNRRKSKTDVIKPPEKFIKEYRAQQKSYAHYRLQVPTSLNFRIKNFTLRRNTQLLKPPTENCWSSLESEASRISPSNKKQSWTNSVWEWPTPQSSSKSPKQSFRCSRPLRTTSHGANHRRKLSVNWSTRRHSERSTAKESKSSQTSSSKSKSEARSSVSKTSSTKFLQSESNSTKSRNSFTPSSWQLLKDFWSQDWESQFQRMVIGATEVQKSTNTLRPWSDWFILFWIYFVPFLKMCY